jgi:hypothetical protein
MRVKTSDGEDAPMSDSENIEEVRRRLEEIQQNKRGRMRWSVSRHTAELALVALDESPRSSASSVARERAAKPGKARRRKRHKRLL